MGYGSSSLHLGSSGRFPYSFRRGARGVTKDEAPTPKPGCRCTYQCRLTSEARFRRGRRCSRPKARWSPRINVTSLTSPFSATTARPAKPHIPTYGRAYSRTTCYVKPIAIRLPFLSRRNGRGASISIERGNETALFDPLDEGWI